MKPHNFDPMLSPTSRMRMARQYSVWGLLTRALILLATLIILGIGMYGVLR